MLRKPASLILLASFCACVQPTQNRQAGVVRVAACQIAATGELDSALAGINAVLRRAAEAGADIACFPETCIYGWVNPQAHQLAAPIPGPVTDRLGDLARKHGLAIAIGLAEKSGDSLFDSAILIDEHGDILLHHRKVNILSELMDPPYSPGENARARVADTPWGKIGMLVCADTFRDDLVAQVAAADPDLILVPFGWAAPADDWPQHGQSLHAWVRATAQRTGAPVVGVDAVGGIEHGPWRGFPFGGQSIAVNAQGVSLGTLADRRSDLRIFEIKLDS